MGGVAVHGGRWERVLGGRGVWQCCRNEGGKNEGASAILVRP